MKNRAWIILLLFGPLIFAMGSREARDRAWIDNTPTGPHGYEDYDPEAPIYQLKQDGKDWVAYPVELPDYDPKADAARTNQKIAKWSALGFIVGLPVLVAGILCGMVFGNKLAEFAGLCLAFCGGTATAAAIIGMTWVRWSNVFIGIIAVVFIAVAAIGALSWARGKSLVRFAKGFRVTKRRVTNADR